MSEAEKDDSQYSMINLMRLFRAIEEIRKIHPDMQTQTAAVFVAVAIDPGLTTKDIMARTGLAQSSCSRNVSLLSEWKKYEEVGLGLVVSRVDPRERRRRIVTLTPKGERFAAILSDLLR